MVDRFGISASAPGMKVNLKRRGMAAPAPRRPGGGPDLGDAVNGGGVTYPILHVSTLDLPDSIGDFGGGLVAELGPDDVFLALVEYDPALAGTGLFEARGVPRLAPSMFDPGRMPRALPGRSASQKFFTVNGRAFCLYAFLGSHARRMALVPRLDAVVRSLKIAPRRPLAGARS